MNHLTQLMTDFVPANDQETSDRQIVLNLIRQHGRQILTRLNPVAHITSSGLILNEAHNKILMVHHNIYNTWTWTGGHADGDADLLAVALKEAAEETGVLSIRPFKNDILSLDILPVYGHFKNGQYVSAHLHLSVAFLLIADEQEPLIINPKENSGVQWVPISQASRYSNEPFMLAIYKKILDRAGVGA
jgi:8-oxo-dGTP pyrophosphatase MutT (NUDIX family)